MIHYALTSLRTDPIRGAGYFVPPVNAIGTIDFRSIPGHTGTDFIFAALDDSLGPVDQDDRVIVTAPAPVHDLSIAVAAKDRTAWADALGMTIPNTGATLADLLAATFLAGDIEGQTAVKPLSPLNGEFSIHLAGHSKVWSRKVGQNNARDPFMVKALALKRADLLTVTDPILRGKLITDALVKGGFEVTQASAKSILGIDEKPLPRRTSYSDSFTRADNAALGGSWTETESSSWSINSNRARVTGTSGDRAARYDQDVSSADHITSLVYVTGSASNTGVGGPTCRHSSSAESFYYLYPDDFNSRTQTWKQVTGTHTQVGTNTAFTFSLPDTCQIRAGGTTITRYINSVSQQASTDSAISGGTRGGMYSFSSSTTETQDFDDWSIDDEVVAGGTLLERRFPRGINRGLMRGVA